MNETSTQNDRPVTTKTTDKHPKHEKIIHQIAAELSTARTATDPVRPIQVATAVQLLDNGDTVPFISRYRKEATGGLTDTDLRTLEERLLYLRELEDRRAAILKSIAEQNKLTPELEDLIQNAETKARLEDLYLPYKPKRRTKAQIAREAGLEPLAEALLSDPTLDPIKTAESYLNPEHKIEDAKSALEGARHILMERFAEDAELIGKLRDRLWNEGKITSKVMEGKEEAGQKFKDYFDYEEALSKIPSHRMLAILRGRNEDILNLSIAHESEPYEKMVASFFGITDKNRSADKWLLETAQWTWRVKLFIQLELEFMNQLREQAGLEAIHVFAKNLKDLLMSAPAGSRATMGLDPGFRTGVKVAIVDATGKLLQHATIYPHAPKDEWKKSLEILAALCKHFQIELISIGNGTASRETDQLVSELLKLHPELGLKKIMVSEAGASVYSASEFAAQEFPDLDVSIRGAVSIARRLQDPLAELVKIEPKAIGVGQYQHDVNQVALARSLDVVVEDCVNAVGVDVNTASIPLLSRVSGLNSTLAKNIVKFRDEHGKFKTRQDLGNIPRLGAKTFEQAAGFLRIVNGDNPLDASAVHPESYPVVERILSKTKHKIGEVIGNKDFLKTLQPKDFTDEKFGIPTVTDIIHELEKPGRDPRPEFKTASFDDKVHAIEDVKPGMILEGVVTNVANFGAFVDIGVHQDGLVHISALSNKFVKDPREVVKAGDIVKAKVLEVDVKRKRISLTLRLEDEIPMPGGSGSGQRGATNKPDARSNTSIRHSKGNDQGRESRDSKYSHTSGKDQGRGNSLFGSVLQEALKKK